jgi:hypothetical protein
MADPTDKVMQDAEGNPYVWDNRAQQYRPWDPNMGALEEFGRAAAQAPLAINEGAQWLNDQMGLPSYQLTEQSPAEVAQANQERLSQGEQGAAAMAGNLAGEMGVGLIPGLGQAGRVGRMVAAETMLQGLQSRSVEEFAMRAGGGAAGIWIGSTVANTMQRTSRAGPKATLGQGTAEILAPVNELTKGMAKQATDKMQEVWLAGRADLANMGVKRAQPAAGAARAGAKVWDQAGDAATVSRNLDIELPPAAQAALDARQGGDTGLTKEMWSRFRMSDQGQEFLDAVEERTRNFVGREIGMAEDFSLEALDDHLSKVGRQIGDFETQAMPTGNIGKPAGEVLRTVENQLDDLSEAQGIGQVKRVFELFKGSDDLAKAKQALAEVRRKSNTWKGPEWISAKNVLGQLEDDIMERFQASMSEAQREQYRDLRRAYSIGKTIQENPNVYSNGKFNVRSLLTQLKKRYKPLAKGTDKSDMAETLEAVRSMSDSTSRGSQTYDRLKNAGKLGLPGAVGGGVVGGLLGLN